MMIVEVWQKVADCLFPSKPLREDLLPENLPNGLIFFRHIPPKTRHNPLIDCKIQTCAFAFFLLMFKIY